MTFFNYTKVLLFRKKAHAKFLHKRTQDGDYQVRRGSMGTFSRYRFQCADKNRVCRSAGPTPKASTHYQADNRAAFIAKTDHFAHMASRMQQLPHHGIESLESFPVASRRPAFRGTNKGHRPERIPGQKSHPPAPLPHRFRLPPEAGVPSGSSAIPGKSAGKRFFSREGNMLTLHKTLCERELTKHKGTRAPPGYRRRIAPGREIGDGTPPASPSDRLTRVAAGARSLLKALCQCLVHLLH